MEEKTVLIIDNNPKNLKLARDVIQRTGVKIIEAENGELGIELARKHLPDLILMDIQLPGMDGKEATAILKKDEKTKNILIVAVTSFAMEGDREEILAAGCDGYISKPFHIRHFVETVESFLEKSKDG
jgi:CheY-like chemotaxis protein